MKRINLYITITFLVLIIGFTSCKMLNTNLSIPTRAIPESFNGVKDTSSSATIQWRDFFNDTLLISLIDTAIGNNMDLQIALQRIEMARSDMKLANGELLPKVGIGVNAGIRKYGLYTMDGAGNITTEITPGQIVPIHLPDFYVGLYTSWEIDIWGKLRNQKKAAVSRYLASIEGVYFVMTSLIAEVATNYYGLLALDNELDIIRETIQSQQNALDMIRILKETGDANELAVQQFEAQLLHTKTLELEVLQRILETESKVNFLLGRYPQPIARQKENLYKDIPANISVGIPSDLLENRPDVKHAEFMVLAAKGDLKAAKAAFFPNINITGSFGLQAFNPAYFFNPSSIVYSALGGLVAPLFNLSALKANFNNAKANQIEAMYNYQKSIMNGYVEVYNEMANINTLQQISQLKTQQADISNLSVTTSLDLFTTGRATYLEVLFTQQNALQSRLELVQVKQQQYNSVINIYKALGGGWR